MATEATSYPQKIRQLAGENPDTLVYRHIGQDGSEAHFSWPKLDLRSSQLAGALQTRGLGHGDRLGIGLRNSPHFVLSVFAAWKLGAVPVPLRWDVPDWELQRLREVIQGKAYLGAGDIEWIDATGTADVPAIPDLVSPHSNGICSSGSTGTPKVIISNQPALYNELYSTPMATLWGAVPRPQMILVMSPMYHTNGFSTLNNLFGGDNLVVMDKFDAGRVVDTIERHRVSTFTASPTMLKRIIDLPGIEARDLSSLQWILQGAAPLPPALFDRWADLIGPEKIFIAYGQTEAIGLTALRGDEWQRHRGSVGRPFMGTEIKILDDDNKELPTGEIGNICMKATNYSGSNYLGDHKPLATNEEGFASAGDLGSVDSDGYLYLADRRVDMIITGGANVFPAEVEAALIEHPKIADIVVIGLRDEEWGRRVHALIEPRDSQSPPALDDIAAYAKARLAAYKVPKSIEILDVIPRSAATKVNRGALLAERGG